jgi:hypothetical protein
MRPAHEHSKIPMLRGSIDFEQTDSHCVSTRTWLYLGAVVLGLSLMGLQDPAALEFEAPAATPDVEEATRLAEAAEAKTPTRSAEPGLLRARASEVAPLPTLRK